MNEIKLICTCNILNCPLRDEWSIFELNGMESDSWARSLFGCCPGVCSFLQKDVRPREIVRLQVWVCESKCGRTFVWPGCAPPSLQDSRSNTLGAGLENGWMLLFVPPSSSVKFAGIIGCRAAGTTAAWPPRDCNCRNAMSAYTGTPHCINRRQAGGAQGEGGINHRHPVDF